MATAYRALASTAFSFGAPRRTLLCARLDFLFGVQRLEGQTHGQHHSANHPFAGFDSFWRRLLRPRALVVVFA
jgi:hypothetical protein